MLSILKRNASLFFLLAVFLTFVSKNESVSGREWTLSATSGDPVQGQIDHFSLQSGCRLNRESAEVPVSYPLDQIASLKLIRTDDEKNNPKLRPIWVCFNDSSVVGADDIILNDGTVSLTIDGQMISVPESFLVSIRFITLDESQTKEWTDIFAEETTDDMLIVSQNDSLTYYRGHIRGITAEKVLFDLDGDTLPVAREKAAGVRLIRSPEKLARSCVARAILNDQSVWSISDVKWNSEEQMFTIIPQMELEWGAYLDANQVIALEFPVEQPDYLSDLRPESIEWTPFMSVPGLPCEQLLLFNQPRLNQGYGSESMSIAGQSFDKGICLKSRTEIVFRLPNAYSRFRAAVGIDDLARPRGNVELVVFGDDRELVRKTIVGTEPAFLLETSIVGIKRIKILVDFGDQAAVGDILTIGAPVLLE